MSIASRRTDKRRRHGSDATRERARSGLLTQDRLTPRPAGAVVVGIDGSLDVLSAVSWAAAEPTRRSVDLHLLQVSRRPEAARLVEQPSRRGRAWLHRALGTARAVAANGAVTATASEGSAVGPTVVTNAVHACLLVVGGRRSKAPRRPSDQTVVHVVTHASCPVVVVPPRQTGAWALTPSRRPVLTVSTGSADDVSTIALATQAARDRGVPLTVASSRNPVAASDGANALGQRSCGHAARWTETPDDFVSHLQTVGRQAQLIVVGPLLASTGFLLGGSSATDAPAARSPCAVVVAPAAPARERGLERTTCGLGAGDGGDDDVHRHHAADVPTSPYPSPRQGRQHR